MLDPNAVIGEPTEEDLDGDGIINGSDNCPEVANLDQADQDADWQGDVCDTDRDGDGFLNELDCEPEDPAIYPGAPELCHNGVDENCNDLVDEEGAYDCIDHFIDADGDGAGATDTLRCLCEPEGEHQVIIAGDCDDLVAAISPLAPEACDGADNNCNLLVDEGCDDDGDGYCD